MTHDKRLVPDYRQGLELDLINADPYSEARFLLVTALKVIRRSDLDDATKRTETRKLMALLDSASNATDIRAFNCAARQTIERLGA